MEKYFNISLAIEFATCNNSSSVKQTQQGERNDRTDKRRSAQVVGSEASEQVTNNNKGNEVKIEIKNRWNGSVLFAHEAEENSLKITLAMALKSRANLSCADLSCADLSGADLYGANLSGANLYGAYLSGANLYGANLSCANLSCANLSCANLSCANLSCANLSGADLSGANLYGANLSGADLSGANLSGADLYGAKNAELAIAKTRILADGDLIGWKKCINGIIVKLRIPEAAKRSSAFGRKCRAEYVDVLEVIGAETGTSQHDRKTTYKAGERVTCDAWHEDWKEECAGGIHFFITRLEAENY